MTRMRTIAAIIGACLVSTMASGAGVPETVATTCQACHGVGGDSPTGSVPRLNGQLSGYIVKRLHDFSNIASEDPHAMKTMWPVVSELNDETFGTIAAYYAGQAPTQSRPQQPLAALGRRIYVGGVVAEDIKPCQSCHGLAGEGHGAAPRLAGQHGEYLTNQLERLRLLTRANDTMFHNTRAMTDEDIRALVAYLSAD